MIWLTDGRVTSTMNVFFFMVGERECTWPDGMHHSDDFGNVVSGLVSMDPSTCAIFSRGLVMA